LAASGFALLMASHHLDCAHCPANRACDLQKIAAHLHAKLKPKKLRLLIPERAVDDSHPDYRYDPNKCVLCGKCVRTCERSPSCGTIGFSGRGFKRTVSTFDGVPLAEVAGPEFAACVEACPTGALSFKNIEGEK
jgi:bidirectional [NiFe] hydrogenase diaphorase subunit